MLSSGLLALLLKNNSSGDGASENFEIFNCLQ